MAPPRAGEVLVRMAYAGLCHSDEHMRFSTTTELPAVGGHEGSAVVQETGPGVTVLVPGDHVALTFVAVCGHCRWCATDRANLCEGAGSISSGTMADGTYRFHGAAVVLAGLSRDPDELTIHLPGSVLARTERRVLGCYFGSCNPVRDIPLVLSLYQRGELQLDELISARYRLENITAGYADLARGRNARGLIAFMDD